MFLAGDEFGNTQFGNNNSYCQDNEVSWLDWSLLEKNRELFEFFKFMIHFRKKHTVIRKAAGCSLRIRFSEHKERIRRREHRERSAGCSPFLLPDMIRKGKDDIVYVAVNPYWEDTRNLSAGSAGAGNMVSLREHIWRRCGEICLSGGRGSADRIGIRDEAAFRSRFYNEIILKAGKAERRKIKKQGKRKNEEKKYRVISFTKQGSRLNREIGKKLTEIGYRCSCYTVERFADKNEEELCLAPLPEKEKRSAWIGQYWAKKLFCSSARRGSPSG